MSGLRDKLDLLKRTSGIQTVRPRVDSAPSRCAPTCLDRRLLDALGGEFRQTARGPLHVTTCRSDLSTPHGRNGCLNQALRLEPRTLATLYPGLQALSIRDALFFDTETTGLAGGSGTYAFLVGIGFFQDQHFVTEQLLLRDHSDEPALLEFLSSRLEGRSGLVSFNGKTFDSQLLSTRFAMHRRVDPFEGMPHFDMLHICRRLFALSRLPDCRLETLEHRVLGAPRIDDTPGWMIPDLFFSYLRERDPAVLKGVIEHNRRDLLAMAGLCGMLQGLLSADRHSPPPDPHVRLGLAKLWSVLGNSELSDAFFQSAIAEPSLREEAREHALVFWARELKRRDRIEQAALLWRRLLARYPAHLEATIELAKWFEHRRRDYRSALLLVEGGLRDRTLTATHRLKLEHRARRLRLRMAGSHASA
jgi:hypothetical protein